MMNIFAPTPETSPSLRNSMAGETTALAKPVMGTRVPAPALAASFWYQPIAVVKADRPMSVALVSVPASVSVKPRAAYSVRRPSPKRQMAPPTKNAHRQSFKSGEGGDAAALTEIARCLTTEAYHAGVRRFLNEGMSFAACRQSVVRELLGPEKAALLETPNNNLGIEYIRTLNALDSKIRPMTILRQGAGHNTMSVPDRPPQFVSATQIRADLGVGHWEKAQPYLVPGGRAVLEAAGAELPSLVRVERAILMKLRTMTAQDWAKLPDAGEAEGLPQRLERAGRQCTSLEGFFDLGKTKRYTHARLRRLALWAFLGLAQTDRPEHPPYLRVLGFNARGRELLKEMKKRASLPILTKPAHARDLDQAGRRLFELEARCTDLYDLCFAQISEPGREWRTGPVILETDRAERRRLDEGL